jgi:hypothetical protein
MKMLKFKTSFFIRKKNSNDVTENDVVYKSRPLKMASNKKQAFRLRQLIKNCFLILYGRQRKSFHPQKRLFSCWVRKEKFNFLHLI